MKKIQIIWLYVIIVVLIIAGLSYFIKQKYNHDSSFNNQIGKTANDELVYKNEKLGLVFQYPNKFVRIDQISEDSPMEARTHLTSDKDEISLLIVSKSTSDARNYKINNEKAIHQDPKLKMFTENVVLGEFEGFKLITDFNRARYIVSRDLENASSLVIDAEISSDSDEHFLILEDILRSLLSSVSSII